MPYASRDKDGKIDGKCFMLFGGNYSYIDVTKKTAEGLTRADWRSRFDTLDIGDVFSVNIDTANYQKFGLEFAKQNGPFMLQAEAFFNIYENAATGGTVNNVATFDAERHGRTISGGYIMARYFLTGDFRKFNASTATWGTASLNHNLDLRKICDRNYVYWSGAWELAAKWSYVDLTDLWNPESTTVNCGDINTLTVGLNWYWSPQARWMFDYSHIMPNKIRNNNVRDASATDLLSIAFRYNF
jgi:phosphate-selective porin